MGGFGLPGRLCGCGFRLGHGLHLSLGFGHLRLTLLVHELAGVRIACGLGLGSRLLFRQNRCHLAVLGINL